MTGQVANDKYNNDWYKQQIGASRIKQILWFLTNALFFINPVIASSGLKKRLLRIFGARIGVGVVLKPGINIKYPWKLSIGDNTWIGERVWIDNLARVDIGKNVCLSQGAFLLTGNHDYSSTSFDLMVRDIVLEDGVWIGAKAIVCPGVRCGSHAVLSAGSVASGSLEPYSIFQGNPAGKVRDRKITK